MEEEIISIETAKLAKEIGFDELMKPAYCVNCDDNDFLTEDDVGKLFGVSCRNSEVKNMVSAPSQTIMHKWIMENLYLYIYIIPFGDGKHWFLSNILSIHQKSDNNRKLSFKIKDNYRG